MHNLLQPSTTCLGTDPSLLHMPVNTDGQLGRQVGSEEDSCLQVLHSSSFAPALTGLSPGTEWQVAAGGDTCFAWTVESSQSRVWAWGNNEYGQCLVCPDDGHEQLTKPRDITLDVQASIGTDASIRDMVVGGSWVAILDSKCTTQHLDTMWLQLSIHRS